MKKIYFNTRLSLFIVFLLGSIGFHFSSKAAIYPFSSTYSGANEVPPNASTGAGTIVGVYDDATNTIFYTITFSGLSANTSAAHFHGPAAAGVSVGVALAHAGFPLGVMSGSYSKSDVLTDVQETELLAGMWYSNIHTTALPGGELRAQIILDASSDLAYSFNRTYSGSQEVPPNASAATGTIVGVYNSVTNTIFYTINFSGLSANSTAAHFHGPATPGVNASVRIGHAGFPTGVTSGTYSKSDVLTDAHEIELLGGMWYSNIHTTLLPGGEIRTQIFFDAPFVAPTITCPASITVSNDPGLCSASVSFEATVTGTPAPTVTYMVGAIVVTSPHVFPVGSTTVNASAINGGGFATCSFTVTVNDTEAPTITGLDADPDILWPPNHKMKDVTISYNSTDNCPGPITCGLSVTSDELSNSQGDGNTSADWEIINDHHVKLRAERSGNGDGRVYTIRVTCTDQFGNSVSETTTVNVPHDMSTKGHKMGRSFVGRLLVNAFPNPSRGHFTLNIHSENNFEKISIRITDLAGGVVELKNNLSGSQSLRAGDNLKPGIYFAEIKQGNEIVQMKLIKLF